MVGASVTVVLLVALGPTSRRRLRVTSAEVLLSAMAVVGVVLFVAVIPAAESQHPVEVPFGASFAQTFTSTAKIQSAADRASKWSVGFSEIRQHPILGSGLGQEFTFWDPGPNVFVTTDINENIGLDLWLRSGLIGLVLFFLVFFEVRLRGDDSVAEPSRSDGGRVGLALVAVVVGLVSKGMVESIFEKYRLATMLGLSLGMLRSVVTSGRGSWRGQRGSYAYGDGLSRRSRRRGRPP